MTLFHRVQDTLATTLSVPASQITPDSSNEDLIAWDSLGQVNLTVAIEQTFDVVIDAEDFPQLTSVQKIMEFLAVRGISA